MPFRQKRVFILFCLSILFLSVLFVNTIQIDKRQEENKGEIEEDRELPYEANEVKVSPENDTSENMTAETDFGQESEDKEYFLGIYGERIAVYSRHSSGEVTLEEVLPYLVKNVYYDELTRGIPFFSSEEKLLLLENLTS